MPDIFDEVAEDLRAEKTRRFWLRYGSPIAVFFIAAMIGLGGWQAWRWYEARKAATTATAFLEIHQASQVQGADLTVMASRFAGLLPEAPAGYQMLIRMREAALLDETGEKARAREIWNTVAADSAVDPLWRDLASLLWVLHGIEIDPPASLAARLAPLRDGPWGASARELGALVSLRAGDQDAARTALQALAADPAAPQGLRDRVQRLAAQVGSPVAPPAAPVAPPVGGTAPANGG
ncbi:hypothetical protein C8P66_102118 [Humitalea rosea]|uniref:Ancillary SecYEG translocon subunit/Cell division coordinator CpoB TPR domain-containing protein n=1 Tax=Humitalea rosea TaxID=990373 RepID=A0A2W7IWW7_9PROT|nr:tetratricopeptide repeat protein [Humitalea rosea]PZW50430.1 hypothetical protein C8P66_102118 [Humitalea rosea]